MIRHLVATVTHVQLDGTSSKSDFKIPYAQYKEKAYNFNAAHNWICCIRWQSIGMIAGALYAISIEKPTCTTCMGLNICCILALCCVMTNQSNENIHWRHYMYSVFIFIFKQDLQWAVSTMKLNKSVNIPYEWKLI